MRGRSAVFVALGCLVLAACATPGGDGDAVSIVSSPGAVVTGPVTIVKQFGAGCAEASSGFASASDAQSDLGGTVGVDVTTQTGELGGQAGAALVASLAAQDTCGEAEVEPDG